MSQKNLNLFQKMNSKKLMIMLFYSLLTFFVPGYQTYMTEETGMILGFLLSMVLYTYYGKPMIAGTGGY